MYVVTGGAGFIGSNLVHTLTKNRKDPVIVVDDLTDGHKFKNIADCNISDNPRSNILLFLLCSGQQ